MDDILAILMAPDESTVMPTTLTATVTCDVCNGRGYWEHASRRATKIIVRQRCKTCHGQGTWKETSAVILIDEFLKTLNAE